VYSVLVARPGMNFPPPGAPPGALMPGGRPPMLPPGMPPMMMPPGKGSKFECLCMISVKRFSTIFHPFLGFPISVSRSLFVLLLL